MLDAFHIFGIRLPAPDFSSLSPMLFEEVESAVDEDAIPKACEAPLGGCEARFDTRPAQRVDFGGIGRWCGCCGSDCMC